MKSTSGQHFAPRKAGINRGKLRAHGPTEGLKRQRIGNGAPKRSSVTYEVRKGSGPHDWESKHAGALVVQVRVTWPAGPGSGPEVNPTAQAVLDAVSRVVSQLTHRGEVTSSS